MDTQPDSIFLAMPPEIRLRIYEFYLMPSGYDHYLLLDPRNGIWLQGNYPPLAWTCKLVRLEMLPLMSRQASLLVMDVRYYDTGDDITFCISRGAVDIGCSCYLPSIPFEELHTLYVFLDLPPCCAWTGLIFLETILLWTDGLRELVIEWKLPDNFDDIWLEYTGRDMGMVGKRLDALTGLKSLRTIQFFGYLPLEWEQAIEARTKAKVTVHDTNLIHEPVI